MSRSLAPEDAAAIQELRRQLWSGRASLMVGAGFSMNSEPLSLDGPSFPSWKDLAEQLFRKLHARPPTEQDYLDPLNLAAQYAAHAKEGGITAFLNETVGSANQNSRPGQLHRMLLSLPWTDVYTTNYDTLLERTLPDIIERRYQIITKQEQIPQSKRPRIIKLHGSTPDVLPLIFTQEDYRNYPRTHAAFINTVQQAILETTLCLVGFSGSDPNFLSWIGWVRDHLGGHAPHVYLCGILGLSNSQRKYYDSLRVMPVDLAPLFLASEFHEPSARHSAAIAWLLHNLNRIPQDRTDWPNPVTVERSKRTGELWTFPPDLPNLIEEFNSHPSSQSTRADIVTRIEDLIADYPGWVVVPFEKRHTVSVLLAHIYEEMNQALTFDQVRTLLRLHSVAQVPLQDITLVEKAAKLTISRSKAADRKEGPNLALLLVNISKCMRECGLYHDADSVIALAETLVSPRVQVYSHVKYEKCNLLIETLRLKSLEQELKTWTPLEADLIGRLRHSALLYEFFEEDDGQDRHISLCREVLHRIRQMISDFDLRSLSKSLISALSIESTAELMLRQSLQLTSRIDDEFLTLPEDRALRSKDALADLEEQVRRYVDALIPDLGSYRELRLEKGFDTVGHNYKIFHPSPAETSVFEVVRVLEASGIPYRHDSTHFVGTRIGSKLGRLGSVNPMRTLSLLARCGKSTSDIEKHWTHWSLKNMEDASRSCAFDSCIEHIASFTNDLDSSLGSMWNPRRSFVRAALVFVGIAAPHCEANDRDRAFLAVARCYSVVALKDGVFGGLIETVSICLRRIYQSSAAREEHIQVLIDLPMWGFGGCLAPEGLVGRPDVFMHLTPQPISSQYSIPESHVDQLRVGLGHNIPSVRYAAILRYDFLSRSNVVSAMHCESLNRAIWSTVKGGVPQYPFVSPPFYIRFAAGCGVDDIFVLIKQSILGSIERAKGHGDGIPQHLLDQVGSLPMVNSSSVDSFRHLLLTAKPEVAEGQVFDLVR